MAATMVTLGLSEATLSPHGVEVTVGDFARLKS